MNASVGVPLAGVPWFRGVYRRIYEILADRLPGPGVILVEREPPIPLAGNVGGAAWRDERGVCHVWFRVTPPPPRTFAHELIHCAEKKWSDLEEIYAYNLSGFVALLASEGVTPPASPLILLDVRPSTGDVLEAVNDFFSRAGMKFRDLAEFFTYYGVIPFFIDLSTGEPRMRPGIPDEDAAIAAISEILAAAPYDRVMLDLALHLIRKLAEKHGARAAR